MALFKFFKKKDKSQTKGKSSPSSGSTEPSSSSPSIVPSPQPVQDKVSSSSTSSFTKPSIRKSSFSHSTQLQSNAPIISSVKDLPEVLLPIVTLISYQQVREYYKGEAYYSDNLSNNWSLINLELTGNDITVKFNDGNNININICDCDLQYNQNNITLTVTITNNSIVNFQFNSIDELNNFYSSILLCKFEFQQLQESYTGALLSSQAINFSDIKTLLSPNNKNIKEEWCVIRFPFLNDKWIRCLLVIKPNDKIEIYTNSNKSKKNLLSTIKNGQSCYTIYPNDPSQIQNNSLLRLFGNCYINEDLLNIILNDETISNNDSNSLTNLKKKSSSLLSSSSSSSRRRSRSNSLSKRLSISSLRSVSSNNTNTTTSDNTINTHQRVSSIDTTISDSSFNNSKTPKKLIKKSIIKSHLIYIIPENHASVKPCEISLRLLIPILNSFSLYGRPQKFISSRNDKNSLLFGLPQLPNTFYINKKSANDLVLLNINNSIIESWTLNDWNLIFKELLLSLINKGWKGGSIDNDNDNELNDVNLSLLHINNNNNNNNNHTNNNNNDYDPMEDFIDRASSMNNHSRSVSLSVSGSVINEVY